MSRFFASALVIASANMLPAQAQTPAQDTAASAPQVAVQAGDNVFDVEGAAIGAVKSVDADNAIIAIGEKQVALPLNVFVKNEKGLVIGSTLAQLQASLAEQEAAAAAQLTAAFQPGADVRSVNGSEVVGQIKTVNDNAVFLTTPQGEVGLPKSAFYLPEHGLSVAFTADQFKQAVADAAAASAAAATAAQ